jgi:hypothetical protein
MFDCVKGRSHESQLLAEDGHDTRQNTTDHKVSIHVTGLIPLVFLCVRAPRCEPHRTACSTSG